MGNLTFLSEVELKSMGAKKTCLDLALLRVDRHGGDTSPGAAGGGRGLALDRTEPPAISNERCCCCEVRGSVLVLKLKLHTTAHHQHRSE